MNSNREDAKEDYAIEVREILESALAIQMQDCGCCGIHAICKEHLLALDKLQENVESIVNFAFKD